MSTLAAKKVNSAQKFCVFKFVDTHGWWMAGLAIVLILGAKIWM